MGCVVQDQARAGRRALSQFQQVVTSAYSGRRLAYTQLGVVANCGHARCSHLGAAVAAADRLFHLVYHGFSCINFPDPSHTYLPLYGPQLGAPDVRTTGAATVSTFWGLAS